ncbi:MAG: DUF952 domain-containing protein [Myxococcales bacterium]|nr:DUF952 domain-containing protein [Myxococcales bacterium]
MELFHITTRAEWDAARASGAYRAPSLETEGFIHLSTAEQWRRVARERFADRRDLVLLRIDAARLSHPVHFEAADGDHFPHLYGELEASAVLDARLLSVSIDGDAALQ